MIFNNVTDVHVIRPRRVLPEKYSGVFSSSQSTVSFSHLFYLPLYTYQDLLPSLCRVGGLVAIFCHPSLAV